MSTLSGQVAATELERRFVASSALQARIAYAQAYPEQQRPRRRRSSR